MKKPISFYPEIAKELNSIEAAIFYQQIYFWHDKGKRPDGFIYKTKKDIEDETGLNRYQQDKARELLVNAKWLDVKTIKANGAPTLHYKPLISYSLELSDGISSPSAFPLVEGELMEKSKSKLSSTNPLTDNTTNTEKKLKKENLFVEEANKILEHWNNTYGTKYKTFKPLLNNLEYWRDSYTLEDILKAITNSKQDEYWCNILTPVIFLRRRNPQGEEVDYIGQMLNVNPPEEFYTPEEQKAVDEAKEKMKLMGLI